MNGQRKGTGVLSLAAGAYTRTMSKQKVHINAQVQTKKPAEAQAGSHTPRIMNRRAFHDYHILDKVEAGLQLVGSEVKSVRKGHVQLAQGFARIRDGEIYLFGCHIDEYTESNQFNHDPTRSRKLLLHKREILRLELKLKKEGKGTTLIPLEMYFKRGFAKILLGLAKGKAEYDKRADIKKREDARSMQRVMKHR